MTKPEVSCTEGRERLEIVAERGAGGDVVTTDVAHHPVQVLRALVLGIKEKETVNVEFARNMMY